MSCKRKLHFGELNITPRKNTELWHTSKWHLWRSIISSHSVPHLYNLSFTTNHGDQSATFSFIPFCHLPKSPADRNFTIPVILTQPPTAPKRKAKHRSRSGHGYSWGTRASNKRQQAHADLWGTSLILTFTTSGFLQQQFVIHLSTLFHWGIGRKATESVNPSTSWIYTLSHSTKEIWNQSFPW